MKTHIAVIALCLLFWSCTDKGTESNGLHVVSGTIISQGSPVVNAKVSLNSRSDLSSQTDPEGKFSIFNVPEGNYTVSVEKTNSDGSFFARTSSVTVRSDVTLDPLVLPKGVKMYTPGNPTATSLTLSWNPTDATDFREYKLYRHTTSGLDEATGTLVHVATTVSDTQFVDNTVIPLTQYFYRVYVMNDYGRLGGSNIVSSSTLNSNIAENGSFETVTAPSAMPDSWSTWGPGGKFSSELQIAQAGTKSLKIQMSTGDWGVFSWGVYQQIVPTKFESGKIYRISFWCKTDTLEQYESLVCRFSRDNYWDGNQVITELWGFVEGPRPASGWQNFSFTFTASSTIPNSYVLLFAVIRAGTQGYSFHLPMTAWLDNIEIKKLP